MKKIISFTLSLIIMFSCVVTAFAFDFDPNAPGTSVPVIIISGHGTSLAYNNGENSFGLDSVLDLLDAEYDSTSKTVEAYAEVLKPFIIKGIYKGYSSQ